MFEQRFPIQLKGVFRLVSGIPDKIDSDHSDPGRILYLGEVRSFIII